MPLLESATMVIDYDEPALTLAELNRISDVTHQWERFQEIRVVRNDRTAMFIQSLGSMSLYQADQFFLVDGVIEMTNGEEIIPQYGLPEQGIKKIKPFGTVGELLEIAERKRGEPSKVGMFPSRVTGQALMDKLENDRKLQSGHSTFGPGGSTVRN